MSQSAATLRLAYLEAMGVGAYVSRYDLPGALPSTRLRCLPAATAATPAAHAVAGKSRRNASAGDGDQGQRALRPPAANRRGPAGVQDAPAAAAPASRSATPTPAASAPAARVALAAITAGDLLWLEDLGDNPLAKDQVALVRAMVLALGRRDADTSIQQFTWPMHGNPQLDQGAEALRMALMGFLQRHIDRGVCSGVVALGTAAADMLPPLAPATPVVQVPSTRQMLDNPGCKRDAWRVLSALRGQP